MDRRYSALKRLYECCSADPLQFSTRLRDDPSETLREIGVGEDVVGTDEALVMLDGLCTQSWEKNPYLALYRDRVLAVEKLIRQRASREQFASEKMYRYINIVRNRIFLTNREFCGHDNVLYYPVAFELSKGCSVQCPFCGLAASRLAGVARYEENRLLWHGILAAVLEIIGPAAGMGPCYFATEPFDNPDYERFMAGYREILGTVPQTTTAAALREPERFRALLSFLGEDGLREAGMRISVCSLKEFYRLMRMYTAEELEDIELIANNPESVNRYSASGRMVGKEGIRYPISCIAGLMVRLPDREVSFMEPVNPSPEYPTGVQTFETLSFRSAEDFREKASFLIEKWAIDRIHADTRLRLTPRVLFSREDAVNGLLIGKAGGIRLRIDSNMEAMLLHLQGDGISVSEAVASGEVNVLAAGRLLGAMETLFEKGFITLSGKAVRDPDEG